MTFIGLEHIPESPRGGDLDKRILQKEALWIAVLEATTPPGLNEAFSFKSFL